MPLLGITGLDHLDRLAGRLAGALEDGDVLLLDGDLGAGKTTFTGALVRALGGTEPVRSPTYTVAHEYLAEGGRRVAHLDLYRHAGTLDDDAWGDLEPLLDEAWLAVVEWPGALGERLAHRRTWTMRMEVAGEHARVVQLHVPAPAAWHDVVPDLAPPREGDGG